MKDNKKLSVMGENVMIEDDIALLHKLIVQSGKLDKDYAVVFVYNDADKIHDELHASECISAVEREMIINSFRKSVHYVYSLSSEQDFMAGIERIKIKHKHVFIYSMAQNIAGPGRRSFIPSLCMFYNVLNIGSGFLPSVYSGCKRLMYKLQSSKIKRYFPKTVYIQSDTDLPSVIKHLAYGRYLLKPDDESASIGIQDITISCSSSDAIIDRLFGYRALYPNFLIQEFISGAEVEVTLLYYNNNFYSPGVCEIIMNDEAEYLNYDIIQTDSYKFREYSGALAEQIIRRSKEVANILEFHTISRIDFRIRDNIPYIIDIGANPTISYHSSSNYMFREQFGDESVIYRILLYKALLENGLLKPSLDKSE